MKEKRMLVGILLALVVVMGGAYALYTSLGSQVETEHLATQEGATSETGEEETQKMAAPDFTMEDENGDSVTLADYIGKPLVLNFWASWCGPCKSEMPDFDAAYQELEGEVEFLMVNVTDGSRETLESAKAYVAEQGYTFPVYFDTALEGYMAYGIQGLPNTFFIDSEGYMVAWANGMLDRTTLEKGIGMIYSGEES